MPNPALAGAILTCTPQQTIATLTHCLAVGQPVFIAGDPGIGKSDIVRQVARSLYGRDSATGQFRTVAEYMRDIRAVLYDAVDLRGLPYIADGVTYWSIPSIMPRDPTSQGLMFYDEINRAPPSVQNALFQLVLDRSLGDYTLPPGWQQVAAGNVSDVGVNKMSSALKSRFLRINMVTSTDEWLVWARANNIAAPVLAYIRDHADQLHRYDARADAFPSPRTWSFVSRILSPDLPAHVERAMIAGSIGETYMPPFWTYVTMFRRLASQFDLDALLAAPDTYTVPAQPALAYAVANGLAMRASACNISPLFTYLARMPVEYAVFAAHAIKRRDPSLESTRAFTTWYAANQDAY